MNATICVERLGKISAKYLAIMICVLFSLASWADEINDDDVQFNIPQQRADRALIEFARQAELTFMFPFAEAEKTQANALIGTYSRAQGIEILLRGTGLRAVFEANGALAITGDDSMSGERKKQSLLGKVLVGFTSVFAVGAADAQQSDSGGTDQVSRGLQFEEIVVTARYREEKAQDIGASIKGMSGAEIERAGVVDFEDIASLTVGLDLLDRGPNQNEISIRGVSKPIGGSSADTFTSNPTVTLFLDDIPVSTNSANQRDFNFFDFNRVEILRGPQPTLFGEGSVGGTIRYFSADPSLENVGDWDGAINLTYSDTSKGGNNTQVQAAFGTALIENTLGIRVAGFSRDDDGFIDNVLLGESDVNHFESKGGRVVLLYTPTDSTSFRLFYHTADDDSGEQWGINPATDPDELSVSIPIPGSVEDDFDLFGLKADFEFDSFTVSSITGMYERERSSALYDPSWTGLIAFNPVFGALGVNPITTRFLTFEDDNFSQEFRLVSEFDGPWNFTAGIFYQDTDFTQDLRGFVPGIAPFTVNNIPDFIASTTEYDSEQISAFVEFTFDVSEQLRLIAGVRYLNEELNAGFDPDGFTIFPTNPLTPVPVAPVVNGPTFAFLGLDTSYDFELDKFLPRIAIEYDINENTMQYFNAAEGARNGNLNAPISAFQRALLTGTPGVFDADIFADVITYGEDATTAVELGIKNSLLDDQLIINAAIYHNDWEDIQAICCAPLALILNDTDARIVGVELETAWQVNDSFSVFANVNFSDAEFTEDVEGSPIVDGNKLTGVPDYSLSAGFDGAVPFGSNDMLFVYHADYRYVDERFSAASNFPNSRLPSFGILNLRAGIETERLALTAFVNNVADTIELQSTNTSTLSPLTPNIEAYVNRPRTIGVSLTARF